MHLISVVITGGPCSGKSTGMSYLTQKISELGYGVLVVPELATEVIMAGGRPGMAISQYDFQEMLIKGQLAREAFYLEFAKRMRHDKVVILFDRGVLDMKAYVETREWSTMLEDLGLGELELRDKRYDAVIHLRTAALGAEEFYTTENNTARLETPEEARIKCELTLQAWIGHPHLHIIDNSTSFELKMKRVLQSVLHTLGEPVPLEIERKYLVDSKFDIASIPVPVTVTVIEQAYLPNGFRIRKRGKDGSYLYTKTHKEATENPLVRIEREQLITAREYERFLSGRLPDVPILLKKRVCFVHDEQYFELDIFKDKNLIVLEIELTESHSSVSLPLWLPIIREVTNDERYRNHSIAQWTSCPA